MSSTNESKYGLTTWHNSVDAEVDIVFVHGLRGHRERTWMKDQTIWPKHLLSKDVEKSRILSFGYDSGVVHSDVAEVTQGSLESDARSLSSLLVSEREKDGSLERPIITVAHSLGGLVCAQLLLSGERAAAGDSIGSIAKNIKGMIFLGTPFGGSQLAKWGDLIRRVYDVVRKTDNNTLRSLKKDEHDLRTLRKGFPDIIRKRNNTNEKIGVVFFYEELPTYKVYVVPEDSASYPGVGEVIPMRANHHDICKFSENDANYNAVKGKIMALIQGKNLIEDSSLGTTNIVHNNGKAVNLVAGTQSIGTQNVNLS